MSKRPPRESIYLPSFDFLLTCSLARRTSETLQEILLLRKLAKQNQSAGIDLLKLNKGEEKKKKKKIKVKDGESGEGLQEEEEYGLKKSRAGKGEEGGGDE